ncbi:hypothetical protein BJ546DRAFT_1067569 [Cryomyces antarcticus]
MPVSTSTQEVLRFLERFNQRQAPASAIDYTPETTRRIPILRVPTERQDLVAMLYLLKPLNAVILSNRSVATATAEGRVFQCMDPYDQEHIQLRDLNDRRIALRVLYGRSDITVSNTSAWMRAFPYMVPLLLSITKVVKANHEIYTTNDSSNPTGNPMAAIELQFCANIVSVVTEECARVKEQTEALINTLDSHLEPLRERLLALQARDLAAEPETEQDQDQDQDNLGSVPAGLALTGSTAGPDAAS